MNLLSPHLKKGKKLRLHDIAIFPWEGKEIDKEDYQKQINRGKYLAQKWSKNG